MKPPAITQIRVARCLAVALVLVGSLGVLSGCATLGPMAGDHPEPAPPDNRPLNEKIGDVMLGGAMGILAGIAQSGFHYSFTP
ncbi:MAG: hypothetical protein P4L99_08280 [Chthoniobacter sp.]|nr:hypothetical protein [Chthoniobacter sp.]